MRGNEKKKKKERKKKETKDTIGNSKKRFLQDKSKKKL